MKLAVYQEALVRLSLSPDVSPDDFAQFGPDHARFALYRRMIRARFVDMAKQAYRGSHELLGDAWFEQAVGVCLAERPPTSPYLRDVIADFGPILQREAQALLLASTPQTPAFVVDLLRFEEAKWRVAYREAKVRADEVVELSFDLAPWFNPALTLLELSHAVHQREGTSCAERRVELLVYRPPQRDDLRWYGAHPLFAAIYRAALSHADRSLSELVQQAAEETGRTIDDALLEVLATQLTLALQRGVLIGSRRQA